MAHPSNFIAGEWVAGTGPELVTIDPSTGRQTWASNASSAEDVDAAVRAAHDAFDAWGLTELSERIDICSRCHPYITGEQRLVDTGGQVERFRRRAERAQKKS